MPGPRVGEAPTERAAAAGAPGERAGDRVEDREPVLPPWARDRDTVAATARVLARRWAWRAGRALVVLPRVLVTLVAYSPRGWRG
ncbi:hypothetical protein WY02_03645 [Pseudonocardia sp. AL041005-10]|nr:hypothetical protein [Pseudonocardia sp. AL041005-10]ALE77690.1 hypothetical protein WY02_03645 [Pseudonocardia sp. AL041005-10]